MWRFTAELWLWKGDAAWHFITVPGDVSDDIAARTAGRRRGFGSVRVTVGIGATSWTTSVFPDKTTEGYVLPVKASVRRDEGLTAGDQVTVEMELVGS